MNVYIFTDMEGISLVTEWDQVQQGHPDYPKYKAIFTAEVNAAVEGALAAGATRIVVNDGHGGRDYNLNWEQLHPLVEIERIDSVVNVFPALDETYQAMLLVGFHAMEGTPNAVLAHTESHPTYRYYKINGREMGEIGHSALMAGYYGVPVAYISGDHAAVREARDLLGEDLPATIVKWGHPGGKATSLHPAESARRIRHDVEQALRRNPGRQPYFFPGPYEVTTGYKSVELADRHAASAGARRIDAFTVSKIIQIAKDLLS